MSGQQFVIEFMALFKTDDIHNGLSIEINPKTFTLDNLDNLLGDRIIEVPLNAKIRKVDGIKGSEPFQEFSRLNDKLTYQYQVPMPIVGNGHKAIKASINLRHEPKSPIDMDIILTKMSIFEHILEENKVVLTDIKETLTDMMFTSQSSQESIKSEDTLDRFRGLNFLDNINGHGNIPKNYLTLMDNIREMKKREEAYGDDATRFAIVSDPDDKIWLRPKSFKSSN